MSFSSDIGGWAKGATEEIAEVNKNIVFGLFESVIRDTPVLEGRLRANWLPSVDDPETQEIDVQDSSGEETVQNVKNFIERINGKDDFSVFLTNNLPYAYRIEYDGWSSTKAPEGMVRKNFIRVSENLRSNS